MTCSPRYLTYTRSIRATLNKSALVTPILGRCKRAEFPMNIYRPLEFQSYKMTVAYGR